MNASGNIYWQQCGSDRSIISIPRRARVNGHPPRGAAALLRITSVLVVVIKSDENAHPSY